jgi:hypothetical protein
MAVALIAGAGFTADAQSPGSPSGTQIESGTTGGAMSNSGAQARLDLTHSQKQKITQELSAEEVAAASFPASVGAKVPASIALKPVPMTVATDIPSVKPYSYAKLPNHNIVLVDPKNRTVAAVIEAGPSTTGSGPSASEPSGAMPKGTK